jgi:PAS domain S-box-containing protein
VSEVGGAETPFGPAEYVSLFFDLFQNSSDVVFLVRARDRLVIDVNDSALSMFRLTREEAIGRTVDQLGVVVRAADLDDLLREVLANRRLERGSLRFRNRWSEEFTLELSATVTQLRGDDVILGIGTLERSQRSA